LRRCRNWLTGRLGDVEFCFLPRDSWGVGGDFVLAPAGGPRELFSLERRAP